MSIKNYQVYKIGTSREENYYMSDIKRGPKPIAKSTGKLDKRRHDNKDTPKNYKKLEPHKHK